MTRTNLAIQNMLQQTHPDGPMPFQSRQSSRRVETRQRRMGWRIMFLVGLFVLVSRSNVYTQDLQLQYDSANAKTPNSIWLADNGVESSAEAFRLYFETLREPKLSSSVVIELIASLSSDDYQIREQATNSLKTIPRLSVSDLKSLAFELSLSPEGRYRLLEVIRVKQLQDPAQIQYAILCDIRDRKLAGLAESIVNTFESLESDQFVRHASIQALFMTTEESDLKLLSSALLDSTKSADIRAGALRSIYKVAPEMARRQVLEISPGLLDAEGLVGLEVARVLVLSQQPQAFEVLFRLLNDDEDPVRKMAFASLVRMTRLDFDRDQIKSLDQAEAVVAETKSWLEKNLDHVNYQWYEASPRVGRRLVCQFDANRVIELDETGKIVWTIQAEKPFACLGLPNGHRFILLYSEGVILEYDGAGRLIKKLEGLPSNVSSLCRRANGNLILAAGQNGNLVVEIDSAGKQVSSFKIEGKPTSAEIGLNGNLIVALYETKQIVEVDSNGETVKTIQLDGQPYHVTPLVTGNFLVAFAQGRRIVECDPEGKVVLEIDCKKYAYHAQKLEDGSISFADETGVFRVDAKGREIVGQSYKSVGKVNYMYSY